MNIQRQVRLPTVCFAAAVFFCLTGPRTFAAKSSPEQARVTRIVRDVRLIPSKAKARPAVINETVRGGTGVRTGDRSRSELTFVDLTIERLGANTIFSFGKAGRRVELESGSMLLRVPKNSGGARMTTSAVTVGITGTTVILETARAGRNRLFVLEGGARIFLNKYPKQSVYVRGGQMENVPPGATRLPPPVNVNLRDLMNKHPLITDFPPLPSQQLIYATMRNPPPPPPGHASGGGPGFLPPIVGGLLSGGSRGGPRTGSRGRRAVGRPSSSGSTATTSSGRRPQTAPTPRRKKRDLKPSS